MNEEVVRPSYCNNEEAETHYDLTTKINLLQVHWERLWDLVTNEENAKYDYFLESLEELIVDLKKQNAEPGF